MNSCSMPSVILSPLLVEGMSAAVAVDLLWGTRAISVKGSSRVQKCWVIMYDRNKVCWMLRDSRILQLRGLLVVRYRSKQASPKVVTWARSKIHWNPLESASHNGVVVPNKYWRPEQRLESNLRGRGVSGRTKNRDPMHFQIVVPG